MEYDIAAIEVIDILQLIVLLSYLNEIHCAISSFLSSTH
jgi:hypothetical protein